MVVSIYRCCYGLAVCQFETASDNVDTIHIYIYFNNLSTIETYICKKK